MVIEWTAFVCTHARGANWKIPDEDFPTVCKMVMANGISISDIFKFIYFTLTKLISVTLNN